MSADSIFDGPIINLLSVLSILIEIFSRAHPKGGWGWGGVGGTLMISNLILLLVVVRVTAR